MASILPEKRFTLISVILEFLYFPDTQWSHLFPIIGIVKKEDSGCKAVYRMWLLDFAYILSCFSKTPETGLHIQLQLFLLSFKKEAVMMTASFLICPAGPDHTFILQLRRLLFLLQQWLLFS